MLFVVIAACLALACAGLAWSYPRAAANVLPLETTRRLADLPRLDFDARCVWLRGQHVRWLDELATDLEATRDDRLRIIAVDEALATVDHELSRRKLLPTRATWMAAAGCLLIAVAAYLGAHLDALPWLLPLALTAVVLCTAAKRRGDRDVERQRERIDALAAQLIRGLEGELPRRRSPRFRRRS